MANPYALDFNPLAQAIQNGQQVALQKNRLAMEGERLGFERQRNDFDQQLQPLTLKARQQEIDQSAARFGFDQQMQPLRVQAQRQAVEQGGLELSKAKVGSAAGFVQQHVMDPNLPPEERAARWNKFLQSDIFKNDPQLSHPAYSQLWNDPALGPQMFVSVARGYQDPLAREQQTANVDKTKAEVKALGQKDVLNEAIANIVKGTMPAAPQSTQPPASAVPGYQPIPPGGPRRQPISDEGAPVDPNIIRTQATTPSPPPGPAPAQPQRPTNDANDVINTPYGPMTRENARRLGGALALAGKGDAGKMLLDAVGQDKFGKEGMNELDKKQINSSNHIARLRTVEQAFDPKFLQIPQRIGMAWTSLKAKVKDITPEQAAPLAEFAEFRRASVENMSRLLNELSGAAVSPQEYERIRNTQPDAGTGIFDGDDPVTFQAKMKGVVRDQKRAVARYNYLRQQGPQAKAPWDVMGLEEIDKVINRRGAEIDQRLRQANPNASPAVIEQETKAQLAREFGIQI